MFYITFIYVYSSISSLLCLVDPVALVGRPPLPSSSPGLHSILGEPLAYAQGSPLKVSISSRYDVRNSLSTSFMALSSILLYTLPALANPKVIRITYILEHAEWADKPCTCSTAGFDSHCMICSTSIQR